MCGVKIGHIHMTSVPVDADGKKLIRTTKELRLVVGRIIPRFRKRKNRASLKAEARPVA